MLRKFFILKRNVEFMPHAHKFVYLASLLNSLNCLLTIGSHVVFCSDLILYYRFKKLHKSQLQAETEKFR